MPVPRKTHRSKPCSVKIEKIGSLDLPWSNLKHSIEASRRCTQPLGNLSWKVKFRSLSQEVRPHRAASTLKLDESNFDPGEFSTDSRNRALSRCGPLCADWSMSANPARFQMRCLVKWSDSLFQNTECDF